jgi:hypothetical protein
LPDFDRDWTLVQKELDRLGRAAARETDPAKIAVI